MLRVCNMTLRCTELPQCLMKVNLSYDNNGLQWSCTGYLKASAQTLSSCMDACSCTVTASLAASMQVQQRLAFTVDHIQREVHGLLPLVLHGGKGPIRQGQQQELLQISCGSLGCSGGSGSRCAIPTRLLLLQAVKDTQQQLCQPSLTHLGKAAVVMELMHHIKKVAMSNFAHAQ